MKTLWLVPAALLALGAPAEAKKKKPSTSGTVKKQDDKPPPPNDKRQNEGAQGRQNATEDAAKMRVGRESFDASGKRTYYTVPADRQILVRDLFRHSSGLDG